MPIKMADNNGTISPPPEAGSSATRLQRNLAEKQRRDKLNGFISELATIVPMVSMASKRLDKTSILRLSAAHLRISQSSLGSSKHSKTFKWCPKFLNTEQVREILEAVDGFLLVTTPTGKIIYISQSVEHFLGHQNIEMIGHTVFSFIHPSDLDTVRSQLQELNEAINQRNGSCGSTRCSFYCRMRERSQPRSDVLTYQFVHVVGHMTTSTPKEKEEENGKGSTTASNSMLKAFVRVVHSNPYNELSLADAIEDEYVTRHGLDGRIIFSDHRISTITGHLPHEVFNMSAYEYIIQEDVPIALFAHQLMFSNNKGTGMIVYRLRTRDDGFVYLKSSGYLQFERASTQVDHFVCVNRQLSESEGEEELKSFQDRFTPHINGSSLSSLYESIKAIQISGLKIPSSPTSIKNGHTSDNTKFPFLAKAASLTTSKSEQQQHQQSTMTNGSRCKSKGVKAASRVAVYSKQAQEKMVFEEDNYEHVFANNSPLTTESSLSGNSPQSSEDICTMSPSNNGTSPLEGMDGILTPMDECSVDDLPGTELLASGGSMDFLGDSRVQNLLVFTDGLCEVSVDKKGLMLPSSSSMMVCDSDAGNGSSVSPGAVSCKSSVDLGENNSSTLSDSMLSSMSDPTDKSSDIC